MGQSDNPPCPSSALLINYAGPLPISLLVDPSARGARSPSSAATPVWARESRLPLVLGFPRNQLSRRRPTSAFPWPGRDPLALRGLPGGRCAEDHPCLAALGARDQGTVGGANGGQRGTREAPCLGRLAEQSREKSDLGAQLVVAAPAVRPSGVDGEIKGKLERETSWSRSLAGLLAMPGRDAANSPSHIKMWF